MAGELEEMVKEGFKLFQKAKQTIDDASKVVKAANEVVLEKRKQAIARVREKLVAARTGINSVDNLADAIEIILKELEP